MFDWFRAHRIDVEMFLNIFREKVIKPLNYWSLNFGLMLLAA
jgi:hypothetical protein